LTNGIPPKEIAATPICTHIAKMEPSSKKTQGYRKRPKHINKRLKQRVSTADRAKLVKKQKAQNDMADN
jgi:hypothetical protein